MIPGSTPQQNHASGSDEAHCERRGADLGVSPEDTQVDERQSRSDDNSGHGGLRKVGQEPVEKEEQDGDQACAGQASQLGPGSRLVSHGCAATADGDGEPLEESSSDV